MKIYKPTLDSLLEEAFGPIYIQEMTRDSEKYIKAVIVSVTAFNDFDKALDYSVNVGTYFITDLETEAFIHKQKDQVISEIRHKLAEQGKKVYPGVISDKIISNTYPMSNLNIEHPTSNLKAS